jgi:hypothetical protein
MGAVGGVGSPLCRPRFYAALVCLPLMYLIMNGMAVGLLWASTNGGIPAILLIGSLGIVSAWKMQRIAAAIV